MNAQPRLRLLFVFADPGRTRFFEGPLELLAERGHDVGIVVERPRERVGGQLRFTQELAAHHDNVALVPWSRPRPRSSTRLSQGLRRGLDHLHYLEPSFDDAPDFRTRAARDAPGLIRCAADLPGLRGRTGRQALKSALVALERRLPVDPQVVETLTKYDPDIVLVTPYVWFAAPQTDWVRAAKALGIRSGACIFSWDNLTSKGSMRELPDLVTVWNEAQLREAVQMHGVPANRVVVTGAQNFDHWFGWKPSRTRAEFAREVGLPEDRPIVCYVESSGYVGGEPAFVARWIESLRTFGSEATRAASIVVRPHPQAPGDEWRAAGVESLGRVAVWPPKGQVPLDTSSRKDLYDSLYHSDAVVGVNTSVFIESAVLDRPSLTLLLPEFRKGQVGTVHFHHLLAENGGPVRVARSLVEHVRQVDEAIDGGGRAGDRARRFVETFVRPHGFDVSGTDRFVQSIEAACNVPQPDPRVVGKHDRRRAQQRSTHAAPPAGARR